MKRLACALLLLGSVACSGGGGGSGPWLTMPDAQEHAQRFFPYTPGTPHASATCDDCHPPLESFTQFTCTQCHTGNHADQATVTASHSAVADFRFASDACYACHRDGTGVNHGPFFPISSGAHAGTACASCHVDPADRTVLGCAGCHPHDQATAATAHAQVAGYAFQSALCVRCHADSQVNRIAAHLPFRVGPGAPHRVGTPDESGSCLRCHPNRRTDKPFGQDFQAVDCLQCHSQTSLAAQHSGRPGYQYATASCLASNCHANGLKGN